jgi:hypothetical protein
MNNHSYIQLFRYEKESWYDAALRYSEQWQLDHVFDLLYNQAIEDGFSDVDAVFESMSTLGIYT